MLILFDLDDTLIIGYMSRPDRNYDIVELLPRRAETLRALQSKGHMLAIVTNQGDVASGFVSEAQMWRKLDTVVELLGVDVYVCYHDVRGLPPYNSALQAARRKPSGAMIREAIEEYPTAAHDGVLMVGDRLEDERAAMDAGVAFQQAHIYFQEAT